MSCQPLTRGDGWAVQRRCCPTGFGGTPPDTPGGQPGPAVGFHRTLSLSPRTEERPSLGSGTDFPCVSEGAAVWAVPPSVPICPLGVDMG